MAKTSFKLPFLKQIWPDMLAFALGLGAAWFLEWKTTDLVWSLWLGSLALGYLTILGTILGAAWVGGHGIFHSDVPSAQRLWAVAAGTVGGLFLLGFFTLHFGGFHAGHAVFLSSFFPLDGMPENAFSDSFTSPAHLIGLVGEFILPVYGAFLLPAIIAERSYVFAPLMEARKAVHEGLHNVRPRHYLRLGAGTKRSRKDPFTRPYVNVIRMHMLIFFFAGVHWLGADSFFSYATVYVVYFFPWKAFRAETTESSGQEI